MHKSGFVFSVVKNADAGTADVTLPVCNGATSNRATAYFASANPINYGTTGTKYFATDTPSTIYVDYSNAIANPIPAGTTPLQ